MPRKRNLKSITKAFSRAKERAARANADLAKERAAFFKAAGVSFKPEHLARQVIFVDNLDTEDEVRNFVAVWYPRWTIAKLEDKGDGWRVIIEEDREVKSFVFINPDDQKVYQRTIVESAPDVDLVRMQEEDPALYLNITRVPDVPRELKPLAEIQRRAEDWEALQRYLLPPKLTPRMEAPRPAKPEELEGINASDG